MFSVSSVGMGGWLGCFQPFADVLLGAKRVNRMENIPPIPTIPTKNRGDYSDG